MKHAFIVMIVALGLTACGSKHLKLEDRYYSLVLAGDVHAVNQVNNVSDVQLVIGPVQLPGYLHGRSLSLQKGPNRIESAQHHFWAEPLDDAIAKVLVYEVDAKVDGVTVDRESGRWTADAVCRVRLEFDALHPSNQARTRTRGRFWLASASAEKRVEFDITKTLNDDGYAHAVDKLRESLGDLAQSIAAEIATMPDCRSETNASDPIG